MNDLVKSRKSANQLASKNWINVSSRSLTIESESDKSKPTTTDDYNTILSVALDQSNGPIAQALVDKAFNCLRKGNPELAWECYKDIISRNRQKYISREQYKQLIKSFNHVKTNHEQALEYILTLVEDMKQLGYPVGRKEKLLVMRLLGLNGNLTAMEKVFEDLSNEQLLVVTDLAAAQKPFNILLTSYNDHVKSMTPEIIAEKSMHVYGEMLDYNIPPAPGTTRLLMNNIRLANNSDEMVEKVWNWVWTKIGMNVSGKTKELDPSLYKDMVLYFASAGRAEYALEIKDIMTKKNIPRSLRMMTALIHKVGRSGDIDKAMDLFNEMVIVDNFVPNLVTFNALIDIHAHKKPTSDVEGANRVFNMLAEVGLQPNIVTFGTMIDMYAKKGDLEHLKKFFYDMTKTHKMTPNPYIFSSVIECFMALNDRKSAMEVLQLLQKQANRRAAPAREAYNLMFKGLVESGHIKESLDLLQVMTQKESYLEAKTFAPLLTYFAKRGDTSGAHQVAKLMTKANVKPTSHTYSILLESHAKAGDIEGAENIFDMFKQKYRPNTYVYNTMLYLYTSKNEMDKVLEIYRRMSKAHVPANEYTYGILMNFYAKRKELKVVEALLDTMESNNIYPGVVCYTMLMQTYFECDRSEDAKNTFKQIIEEGLQPTDVTMSILVKGCVDSNQLNYAQSILLEAIEKSKQNSQYNNALLKDSEIGTQQAYEKYLPETIEDVLEKSRDTVKAPSVSSYLFTPVLNAYTKSEAFGEAKNLVKTMMDLSVSMTVPTFTAVMNLFRKEKNYDSVEALWYGLYNRKDGQQTVDTLDSTLPSLPLPPQTEIVTDLLTFENVQFETDQVSNFALSIYMDALIEQQQFSRVRELWDELTAQKYQFDEQNMNRYIVSLLENKQVDEACRVATDNLFGNQDLVKNVRKRDDIFISNDNPLHTRTCLSFAEALDVPGYQNMGEPRLRISVTEKIREHLASKTR